MTATVALDIALNAAADAVYAHPYYASDRGDCGRAWIVLPQAKGRKALLDVLSAEYPGIDTFKHHAGGTAVRILGNVRHQSRAIYEAGCDAFVTALRAHGYEAHVYSYAD